MATFFDSYTPYFSKISSGHYPQAVDDGLKLLTEIRQFSPEEYKRTLKGTPFYFLGISAFLSHDYQTATFFFDAAASEDLKHKPRKPDAPALLFMQLDDQNTNQAAHPLVKNIVSKLEAATKNYNARAGRTVLTVADVRKHFLKYILASEKPHLRSLITAFISFFGEWDYRTGQIELSEAGSREPFFMHLFRGCLLFESLLKENPKKRPQEETLGKILKNDLFSELGIPQRTSIRASVFDGIAKTLVPNQSITEAIVCAGKTRNTLGHNVVWISESLSADKYNLLAQNIVTACLHAISTLYR